MCNDQRRKNSTPVSVIGSVSSSPPVFLPTRAKKVTSPFSCASKRRKARPTAFDVLRFAILSRRDAFRAANGGLSILSRNDQVCSAQQTRGRHASRHDSKTSHPARRLSSTTAVTGTAETIVHFKTPSSGFRFTALLSLPITFVDFCRRLILERYSRPFFFPFAHA